MQNSENHPTALPPGIVGKLLAQLEQYCLDQKHITDAKHLHQLILILENKLIPVALILKTLFPTEDEKSALSSLSGLKIRLNRLAEQSKVNIILVSDQYEHYCWFEDLNSKSSDTITNYTKESLPEKIDHLVEQTAFISDERKHIKFFVSYSNDDQPTVNKFIDRWKKMLDRSTKYRFDLWNDNDLLVSNHWHRDIQKAIDQCHFGIMLISRNFFSSDYILTNELPQFIYDFNNFSTDNKNRIAIPVGLCNMPIVGKDLAGLQEQQIYLLKKTKQAKFFNQCESDSLKNDFVDGLDEQIHRLLDKRKIVHRNEKTRALSHCLLLQREKMTHDHAKKFLDEQSDSLIESHARVSSLEKDDISLPSGKEVKAVEDLMRWARDKNGPPYCALLGELGMGKTTSCQELTRKLIDLHQSDPDNIPLPVYLDLRALQPEIAINGTLAEIIDVLIARNWRGGKPNEKFGHQMIFELIQQQGGLIIYDGLDEILVHLTEHQGRRLIRELWRIRPVSPSVPDKTGQGDKQLKDNMSLEKCGKVIISCRSHYFRTLRDEKNLYTSEGRDLISHQLYNVLVLLPFKESHIRRYLELNLPGQNVDQLMTLIASIHNLPEMAERPYTLSLIAGQITKIEKARVNGDAVMGVTLYRNMVLDWLDRDDGKHQFTKEHKQLLMEQLAATLWRQGIRNWDIEQLENWLLEYIDDTTVLKLRYAKKDNDLLLEDLRTATFLTRPDEKSFRFAHSSLLEYFLACYLYRVLNDESFYAAKSGTPKNKNPLLQFPMPSQETLDFLGQLLAVNRSKENIRSMEKITQHYQKYCSELVLAYCLLAIKKNYPRPRITNMDLTHADLQGWKFIGDKNNPLDLRSCRFDNANLNNTHFSHVLLSNSTFSHSTLDSAELHQCKLNKCDFDQADLNAAIFRQCDLSYTSFITQYQHHTQWLACDLQKCQWPDKIRGRPLAALCKHPQSPRNIAKHRKLATFAPHNSIVRSCAFSPCGQQLLSASGDKTLKLWDVVSGSCLRSFEGHLSLVYACAFSPDGQQLLSASGDKTLKLWDVMTGICLRSLEGHSSPVYACAFSPDGQQLLSASDDNTLKLWNARTGACLRSFEGHSSPVYACSFSPDGKQLLSASDDNTLKSWDITSDTCQRTFEGHSSPVTACAFSPNGKQLLSASWDKTLKLWDAATGECLRTFESHFSPVTCCAFSPDGQQLLSSSGDNTLKLWDIYTSTCLHTFEGHSAWVYACAFSPGGQQLLSASDDSTLKLWDTTSGVCLRTFESYSSAVAACTFSPNGRQLLSASRDNNLKLWDVAAGTCLHIFEGHSAWVNSCAFSPDGQQLLSASDDNTLKLWDTTSGICLYTFEGHSAWVYACAFSSDGQQLLSASWDKKLMLWDMKGNHLRSFQGHSSPVTACSFSPNNKQLLSSSRDKTLKLWDAATGTCLRTFKGHSAAVTACSFSPDGQQLLSASDDNTLKLWDSTKGTCLCTFEGHSAWVYACAFSPDGQQLLSASNDNTLKLWDTKEGTCIRTFEGHSSAITACGFSPDTKHLMSAASDGTIMLWDNLLAVCCYRIYQFKNNNWATIESKSNELIAASHDAWRWLGWYVEDADSGLECRYPIEIFGGYSFFGT